MSASPTASALPSTKRPLDDESSQTGPDDQPEAKRPALEKGLKDEEEAEPAKVEQASAPDADPVDIKATDETKPSANGHTDAGGDTVVPDAPNGATTAAAVLETQPIQSTAGQHDRSTSHGPSQHQDETGWIHVRAVISSAEAATVIGKAGENVSQIRRLSGAKCTVSDYARGAVERILTVSGLVDATAKVRGIVPRFAQYCANLPGFWLDYSYA